MAVRGGEWRVETSAVQDLAPPRRVSRKKSERHGDNLHQHEALLESVLASVSDGIAVGSPEGIVLRVNPALVRALGFDPTGAHCRDVADRLQARTPDGRPVTPRDLPSLALHEDGQPHEAQVVCCCAGGRERTLLIRVAPRLEGTVCVGWVSVIHDLQQAEPRSAVGQAAPGTGLAAERLAKLQAITAALSAPLSKDQIAEVVATQAFAGAKLHCCVLALTEEGGTHAAVIRWHGADSAGAGADERLRLSLASPSCDAIRLGAPILLRTRAEVAERYGHLEERDRSSIEAILALPLEADHRVIGSVALSFTEPQLFPADEQELWITIARQCAQALERARLFEAERRLAAEARREAELRELFMAILGHDLRAPLSTIAIAANILLGRVEASEQSVQVVQRIERSARRINAMVCDLLDFTRARLAALPVVPRPIDLHEEVRRALDELAASHAERTISLCGVGDCRGCWDPERMAQVITNLVSNALSHGDLTRPVSVTVRGEPSVVVLEVHNFGAPIPPAILPTLFEPFQRTGRARAHQDATGVGLGLYIVRQLVQAHGGTVDVRSASGEGTSFMVRLPRGTGESGSVRTA